MSVIIPPDGYLKWLEKATYGQQALQLLDNDAYDQMIASPVSEWVNNPRHDGERCLR